MDISSFRSSAELGMDEPFFIHHRPVNSLDQELNSAPMASFLLEDVSMYFAQQPEAAIRPLQQQQQQQHLNSSTWNSCKLELDTQFLDSNFNSESIFPQSNFNILKPCQGTKRISTDTKHAQAQDHILAERKRRQKITQSFIALSAVVPGLKKMDKASVLGDAIKYMKQLQEKVKILEEQTKKRSMESVVFVNKRELNSSSDGPIITEPLPQIEARFCDKDVLIIIHCEKIKGSFEKAVAVIEKSHLSVVNSSVMTFGDSALNISVIARKDEDYSMNMKELVTNLHEALKRSCEVQFPSQALREIY